jgi:hypothetical protein
MLRTVPTS